MAWSSEKTQETLRGQTQIASEVPKGCSEYPKDLDNFVTLFSAKISF